MSQVRGSQGKVQRSGRGYPGANPTFRFTNLLLAELYSLLDQAQDIAAQGIEDNLDPGCFHIFTYLQRESKILQQMVKAEIATHISKNKWG